jgi:hypothetical protein
VGRRPAEPRHRISTLNEGPLHAALKDWYAGPDDRLEVPVDGFLVDIVRGDLLIEVQTSNVSAIRDKLRQLAGGHRVRLVYPIAREKWIVRLPETGDEPLGRRKSPKRGALEDVFGELVSLPRLLARPGFSVEAVLIQEEEVRRYDPERAWRRRHWVTEERRLLGVLEGHLFETPSDLCALMPEGLEEPFTTADLAAALERTRHEARQMAYCLREMGAIEQVGRERRGILYVRAAA